MWKNIIQQPLQLDIQKEISSIADFSLAKDGERGWHSRLCTRYRKVVREYINIENDFYSNDSLNDNLESKFYKGSWRCSKCQVEEKNYEYGWYKFVKYNKVITIG